MARLGLFLTDIWEGILHSHSIQEPLAPAEYAQTEQPGQAFAARVHTLYGGSFDVDDDNQWIDTDLGSVSLTRGTYTAETLRAEIETELLTLDPTFLCLFDATYGRWSIKRTAGPFSLLWSSGGHAGSTIGDEIGFDVSADDTGLAWYFADERRYHTHTWLLFHFASSPKNLDLAAIILAGDDDTDFSNVRLIGRNAIASPVTRYRWINASPAAARNVAFSTRSDNADNPIQVALGGAVAATWWLVSWRHHDESQDHRIGLARAFAALESSTRTVRAIPRHGIDDRGEPLGPGNYHPARLLPSWQLRLDLERWPAADIRSVLHPLRRRGRGRGLVAAVNWTDIEAGSLAGKDEAERGLLLWCAPEEIGEETWDGESSDWISATVDLRQVT